MTDLHSFCHTSRWASRSAQFPQNKAVQDNNRLEILYIMITCCHIKIQRNAKTVKNKANIVKGSSVSKCYFIYFKWDKQCNILKWLLKLSVFIIYQYISVKRTKILYFGKTTGLNCWIIIRPSGNTTLLPLNVIHIWWHFLEVQTYCSLIL